MLVDRDAELDRIGSLVEGAREGRAGALVLAGPAGIGKSALLDAAAATATDLRVVRVVGIQAERDVPYAGLHALFTQLSEVELPPIQERALDIALGRVDGERPGRLVLGAATLGVLGAHDGLLVVVDDLQWLDEPSADALCFAARRLVVERVAMLAAVRSDAGLEPDSPASGLPTHEITGIRAAATLLPGVHPHVASALASGFDGNPLAMLESAAGLTTAQAAGDEPLPRLLPTSRPEGVYAGRLAELPLDARAAARLLAHSGRAPRDVLIRALTGAGLLLADLTPLEDTGLCRLDPVVTWRHPLARHAAARGTAQEVRSAHRLLADAWDTQRGAVAVRAWHLAEATDGPDQTATDALSAAAAEAERRDASADAADAWERAARLTPRRGDRHLLLERAADAALRAGATVRASALLDEALMLQPDADAAARLLHRRARVEHTLGRPDHALELFAQAVDLAATRPAKMRAAAEALYSAMYSGRPDQATRMAELARIHHDPTDDAERFLAAHARGAAASLNHDQVAAHAAMDEARAELASGVLGRHPDLILWAVNIELFDPVGEPVPPEVEAAVDRARAAGDLTWLPRVLRLAAIRESHLGRWTRGQSLLDEAELVSRMSGQKTQLAEALLMGAERDATQGDFESARTRVAEARRVIAGLEVPWLASSATWTEAWIALSRADVVAALPLLRALNDPDLALLVDDLAGRVEGSRGTGSDAESTAWALAAQADVGTDPVVTAAYRLAAGEHFRRAGQRRLARAQLRQALDAFAGMGAVPWLTRTEEELRASGATLRRTGSEALTPSELRVAALATEGRSNKEVAAALYLSPKTVEFHLGRAYRKLGVTNRTALARALEDAEEPRRHDRT